MPRKYDIYKTSTEDELLTLIVAHVKSDTPWSAIVVSPLTEETPDDVA
jgi:hypothetical protein